MNSIMGKVMLWHVRCVWSHLCVRCIPLCLSLLQRQTASVTVCFLEQCIPCRHKEFAPLLSFESGPQLIRKLNENGRIVTPKHVSTHLKNYRIMYSLDKLFIPWRVPGLGRHSFCLFIDRLIKWLRHNFRHAELKMEVVWYFFFQQLCRGISYINCHEN